jgi:hypothetical protein
MKAPLQGQKPRFESVYTRQRTRDSADRCVLEVSLGRFFAEI